MKRVTFAIFFVIIVTVEILIINFGEPFAQNYVFDVLLTAGAYFLTRIIFPRNPKFLSQFIFAAAVVFELIQLTPLFDAVKGTEIIIGRGFDFMDLLGYAIGGVLCFIADYFFIDGTRRISGK